MENPSAGPSKSTHKSVMQLKNDNVILCMQIVTFVLLCATFFQFCTRQLRPADFVFCLAYGALQALSGPLCSVLSMSLAIWHLTWTSTSDLPIEEELPSYSDFMRNLPVLPASVEPEECMICWSSDNAIAELPCGHRNCTECLQLMGPSQTACSMCRKPLFKDNDRVALTLLKASNAMCVGNVTLSFFEAGRHAYTSQYLLLSFSLIGFAGYGYLAWINFQAYQQVEPDHYWSMPPNRDTLNGAWYRLGCQVFVFCTSLWNWHVGMG